MNTNRHPGIDEQRRASVNLLVRVCWPLLVQDVRLPWSAWLESVLTEPERQRLSRERISYSIRSSHFRLGFGPLWLKKAAQTAHEMRLKYEFWLYAVLKVVVSLLVVLLPFSLLMFYRVVLPAPASLLEAQARVRSAVAPASAQPAYPRAEWSPYAVSLDRPGWHPEQVLLSGFETLTSMGSQRFPELVPLRTSEPPNAALPYLLVTRAPRDSRAPYSAEPVALAADGYPLELSAALAPTSRSNGLSKPAARLQGSGGVEILGANRVVGSYLLWSPVGSSSSRRCRLEVRDEQSRVVLSVEEFPALAPRRPGWLQSLLGRPGRSLSEGRQSWKTFRFRTDAVPRRLIYTVREVVPQGGAGESADLSHRSAGGSSSGPPCAVAVTAPVFQTRLLRPMPWHRLVVVVADGIWEPMSRDPSTMPGLQAWSQKGAVRWPAHFATSTASGEGVADLLGLTQHAGAPRQMDSLQQPNRASQQLSLFEEARRAGFRTAYFGELDDVFAQAKDSPTSEGLPSMAMGFPIDGYRNAGAIYQALDWLAANRGVSSFTVIRLSDLRGRWVPPWASLRLDFLASPLSGYARRLSSYQSMLHALDDAFLRLVRSLEQDAAAAVGPASPELAASKTHIVFVGAAGAKVARRPVAASSSEGGYTVGATFELGGQPSPDILHVPLVVSSSLGVESGIPLKMTTHRELRTALAAILQFNEPKSVLESMQSAEPVLLGYSEHPALVSAVDEGTKPHPGMTPSRWRFGFAAQDVGAPVYSDDVPVALTIRSTRGLGSDWVYDRETGASHSLPSFAVSDEARQSPEYWQNVMPQLGWPSLILTTRSQDDVPFSASVTSNGKGAEPAVAFVSARSRMPRLLRSQPLPQSISLRTAASALQLEGVLKSFIPLMPADALGFDASAVVLKLAPRQGDRVRLDSVAGVSVCGVRVPSGVLELEGRVLDHLLKYPPACALSSPVRRWYDRDQSQKGSSGVEVWVGWP